MLTKAKLFLSKYKPELTVAVGLVAQIPVTELHGTALDVVRAVLAAATVLGLRAVNVSAAKQAAAQR